MHRIINGIADRQFAPSFTHFRLIVSGLLALVFLSIFSLTAIAAVNIPQSTLDASEESLQDQVFVDPTNIELNFALLRAQLAAKNLSAAALTLERILLLDPTSKTGRILLAEVQYKLGNLATAQVILDQLKSDSTTPDDMRAEATRISKLVADQQQSAATELLLYFGYGVSGNARSSADHPKILYNDILVENTTDDKSEGFYDYEISAVYDYEMPFQTPQFLTFWAGLRKRDYVKYSAGDVTSYLADIGYRSTGPLRLSIAASWSERRDKKFEARLATSASYKVAMADQWSWMNSLSSTRFFHFDHPSIANHKARNGYGTTIATNIDKSFSQILNRTSATAGIGFGVGYSARRAVLDHYASNGSFARITARMSIGGWRTRLTATDSLTHYRTADPLVSATKRRDRSLNIGLEVNSPSMELSNGGLLSAKITTDTTKTKSNIPNFTRNVNSITFGAVIKY